jgi:hypothetical protein
MAGKNHNARTTRLKSTQNVPMTAPFEENTQRAVLVPEDANAA